VQVLMPVFQPAAVGAYNPAWVTNLVFR
jgi:hypothetical protein